MAQSTTPAADLIVESIARHSGCCLDDVVTLCPELTWNQIFFEVDRLSRGGFLKPAMMVEHGRYTVVIPPGGDILPISVGKCASTGLARQDRC